MPRIRSVHPGLWTDEGFVQLSMAARLFMIGLWNEADDYGLFAWKPTKLKMRLAPADSLDAGAVLQELVEHGFVIRHERGDKDYGLVKNFRKYQRPKHPTEPLIPLDEGMKREIGLLKGEGGPQAEARLGEKGAPQEGVIPPNVLNGSAEEGDKREEIRDKKEEILGQEEKSSSLDLGEEDFEERAGKNKTGDERSSQPSSDLLPADLGESEGTSAVKVWNDLAEELALPEVQKLTAARKERLRARLRECGGLGGWAEALVKIRDSRFLRGENESGWKVRFDFVLQEGAFTKLREGFYDDRSGRKINEPLPPQGWGGSEEDRPAHPLKRSPLPPEMTDKLRKVFTASEIRLWFETAAFSEDGKVLRVQTPFIADWIINHFETRLRVALGAVPRIEVLEAEESAS